MLCVLQVQAGDEVSRLLKRGFFIELQSRFGNLFFVREEASHVLHIVSPRILPLRWKRGYSFALAFLAGCAHQNSSMDDSMGFALCGRQMGVSDTACISKLPNSRFRHWHDGGLQGPWTCCCAVGRLGGTTVPKIQRKFCFLTRIRIL